MSDDRDTGAPTFEKGKALSWPQRLSSAVGNHRGGRTS